MVCCCCRRQQEKKNNNSVSQYFRDQIQSQRLAVETGFPSILVDLIVKNRRRRSKTHIGNSSVPGSSLPTPSPLELLQQSSSSLPTHLNDMVEEEICTVDKENKDGENCEGLLMAMLIGAFLVGLTLGAKQFAVGLTLSAFVLIFGEYFRKRGCYGVFDSQF